MDVVVGKTPGDFLEEMTPGPGRLFVLLDEFQTMSAGGVALPEMHSEEHRIATIGKTGPECRLGYKAGDRIFVGFFAGTALHLSLYGIAGDRYRIVREDEVMGWLGLTQEDFEAKYGNDTHADDSPLEVEAGEEVGP